MSARQSSGALAEREVVEVGVEPCVERADAGEL